MDKDFKSDDPLNWKWGIFYVNRNDSRLIVPKRIKSLGWTLNFAHLKVWIGVGLILLIILAADQLLK
jgi:uncharacterized membrane protein